MTDAPRNIAELVTFKWMERVLENFRKTGDLELVDIEASILGAVRDALTAAAQVADEMEPFDCTIREAIRALGRKP